jgi:hypothetical protein
LSLASPERQLVDWHLGAPFKVAATKVVVPARRSSRSHQRWWGTSSTRLILLDAGQKDDYNLHWGHRLLSHYLTQAGVPHVHMENPGNHGGRWPERYQVALEWLAGVLEREPA